MRILPRFKLIDTLFPYTTLFRSVGGTVARLSRDGFGENLTTGLDNYNRDSGAGRLAAELDACDAVEFRIAGDYTEDRSDPRGGHRLIPGLVSGTPVLKDVFD